MYRLATEEETADLAARPDLAFFSYDNKVYARTNDAKEAVIIKTNYLSHEKDATANLIKAFNPINGTMKPENYRDVKVQFVVKEQEDITEEKILINYAQIGEIADENGNGGITDRDSTPGQWIDDEDDQGEDSYHHEGFLCFVVGIVDVIPMGLESGVGTGQFLDFGDVLVT